MKVSFSYFLVFASVVSSFFLQGCVTNISGDLHYNTGYVEGHVYRLKKDVVGVVMFTTFTHSLHNFLLIRPDNSAYDGFVTNGSANKITVSAGARILITSVVVTNDIENGKQMFVSAKMASESYNGLRLPRFSGHAG